MGKCISFFKESSRVTFITPLTSILCVSEEEKPKSVQTEKVMQLKMEAERRKKEVDDLTAALAKNRREAEERRRETQRKDEEVKELRDALEERAGALEEVKKELEEANQLVEEKSREADECLEKYCSLVIKVHKLEESNEGLKVRLEHFTAARRRSSRTSSAKRHEAEKDDNTENLVPSAAQGPSPGKRGHGEDSAQEVLHKLTKKLKAGAMTTPKTSREEEEEDFRPEGLPELVQRGWWLFCSVW